ncbi:hypothetical protein [Microbacterium karelineae]|uniref:hypothetical protein n=1 Tax=Microbacterium karelineae TaxID=2654283 RepID=UPI0012EAD5F8|nr:hypothetical protein [Microbacterium karelineae]
MAGAHIDVGILLRVGDGKPAEVGSFELPLSLRVTNDTGRNHPTVVVEHNALGREIADGLRGLADAISRGRRV